jgi:hypothetical protein
VFENPHRVKGRALSITKGALCAVYQVKAKLGIGVGRIKFLFAPQAKDLALPLRILRLGQLGLLGCFLCEQTGYHLPLRFVGFALQQFVEPVDIGLDDSEHDTSPLAAT